jgi:hypothetical protein
MTPHLVVEVLGRSAVELATSEMEGEAQGKMLTRRQMTRKTPMKKPLMMAVARGAGSSIESSLNWGLDIVLCVNRRV